MATESAPGTIDQTQDPQGSYWPIIVAVSFAAVIVGLMVNLVISMVGAAILIGGIIAWGLERFHGPIAADDEASALGRRDMRPADVAALGGTRSGRWGMVWFISSEAVFFGNLIAAYLYLRMSAPQWPPAGTPPLDLSLASLNTVVLLASTIPAYYAERAIRNDNAWGVRIGLLLSALLGVIFLVGQAFEYAKIGFTPQANIFFAGFFTLTGFHGAHVVVGISLLLVMLVLSLRGHFSARRSFPIEFASTYWHFIDVVWIFLFTVLYLVQ